jgi:hypothetical protein
MSMQLFMDYLEEYTSGGEKAGDTVREATQADIDRYWGGRK